MIIGSGSHRYEVQDLWGKLPEGLKFGTTHAVCEDQAGRIYIHSTGEKSMIVFDANGNYLSAWGEAYSKGAHGCFYNKEADGEYFYLSTTGLGFVAKVTLDGKELFRIGTPPRPDIYDGEKKRFVPTECAVAKNGDIYIADGYGQPWVHQYSPKGEYKKSFGGLGDGPGQLKNVHGIKIDSRSGQEKVLVADRGNRRLQYFSLAGDWLKMVVNDLRLPCTVNQWRDELYIPDLHSRVTVLDKNDKLILQLGDRPDCWTKPGWPNIPPSDWVVGAFSSPHDLHVDAKGNIYVAEWLSNGTGKITKLIRQA